MHNIFYMNLNFQISLRLISQHGYWFILENILYQHGNKIFDFFGSCFYDLHCNSKAVIHVRPIILHYWVKTFLSTLTNVPWIKSFPVWLTATGCILGPGWTPGTVLLLPWKNPLPVLNYFLRHTCILAHLLNNWIWPFTVL